MPPEGHPIESKYHEGRRGDRAIPFLLFGVDTTDMIQQVLDLHRSISDENSGKSREDSDKRSHEIARESVEPRNRIGGRKSTGTDHPRPREAPEP